LAFSFCEAIADIAVIARDRAESEKQTQKATQEQREPQAGVPVPQNPGICSHLTGGFFIGRNPAASNWQLAISSCVLEAEPIHGLAGLSLFSVFP
jgi:hypothetical protein